MIQSMTGYGSANGVSGSLELEIELKAVNNRYLDVSVRMPRRYLFAEESLKKRVGQLVHRGKVDIFINVDSGKDQDVEISLNEPLAEAYVKALHQLAYRFGLEDNTTAIQVAKMPDVLKVEQPETDNEAFARDLLTVLDEALESFNAMRRIEGEKLRQDITSRLDFIETLTAQVEKQSPQTVTAYRAKLEQRMTEILENTQIEESRILTEAAIFADRVAVDEEITRLRSHVSQLRDILDSSGAVGRKIDFLLQELGRETNTIGSKCQDLELGKIVIELKAEIEKIREQAQNIE
ncbi:MAG: YicC family protein [Oscillospiraceae bacterium]|nr:YicC family protein [Oscillospiraceae bacterium]